MRETTDEEEGVDSPDKGQALDGKDKEDDPSSSNSISTRETPTDIAADYLNFALEYLTKEVDQDTQQEARPDEVSAGSVGAGDDTRLFGDREKSHGKDRVPTRKGTRSPCKVGNLTGERDDGKRLQETEHHTNHSRDQGDDIFGKLFSQVHNTVPKTCTKEAEGNLYSFSCSINSNLYLYLPPDFNLCAPSTTSVSSNLWSRKAGKTYRRRREPGHHSLSHTSMTESEEDGRSGNEYVYTEEEDGQFMDKSESSSKSQKCDPETKVIQTRSGRKTRFTFFSRTLIDSDTEEIYSPPAATPKPRRPEQETTIKPSTPGRKRGRPRKVKDNKVCVMKCKVVEDTEATEASSNINVLEDVVSPLPVEEREGRRQAGGLLCSVRNIYEGHGGKRVVEEESDEGGREVVCNERERRGERQESVGIEKRKEEHSVNSTNSLIAFMCEQVALRRRREVNLMVVMKRHQTFRKTVLTEMLNVVHSIKTKLESS